jgi:hypothetical protein
MISRRRVNSIVVRRSWNHRLSVRCKINFPKNGVAKMKTIRAFVFTTLVVGASSLTAVAQTSSWSATISSQANHESLCSAALPSIKPLVMNSRTAPNCGIYVFQTADRWSDSKTTPRSSKGKLVTGFRFSGWVENGKAKIFVWVLLNREDAQYAQVQEQQLTEQLVDTLVMKPGTTVVIHAFKRYGVKPVEVSVSRTK